MAPDRERLSSIDTTWYRMESASNHANIGGVLVFDEPLDFERVREVVEARLVRPFPRFRQRVVESTGRLTRPRWREVDDFSLDDHLHRMRLPDSGDRRVLQQTVGELMTEALEMDRPLWQIHQIDGYRGGSVLFAQLHHCLGDGFALARVLLSIADEGLEVDESDGDSEASGSKAHRSLRERVVDEIRNGGWQLLRRVRDVAVELGHIASMSFDKKTRLKQPLDGEVRVAWSETYRLDELKTLAHGLDATINDVLMAAVTDAVRRLLVADGESVGGFDLRAIVPVNLRPARSIEEMEAVLGNEFGLVFLDLPIHADGLDERLTDLKATIEALKTSPEAAVAFGILTAEGYASALVERLVNWICARKASLVVSNVPGPKDELELAGSPLRELMFWVPHPGPNVGLGISLISYAGRVSLGVRADTAVVDDPGEVVAWLEEAFAAMKRRADCGGAAG